MSARTLLLLGGLAVGGYLLWLLWMRTHPRATGLIPSPPMRPGQSKQQYEEEAGKHLEESLRKTCEARGKYWVTDFGGQGGRCYEGPVMT